MVLKKDEKSWCSQINPDFARFVNDPANEKFVKGMANHKLTEVEKQDIGGLLAELNGASGVPPKVSEWLDRSEHISELRRYSDLGKVFETNILNALKTRQGSVYNKLKETIKDLDERKLISQMQFCLPGKKVPCKAAGEYFIADQVWVKYDAKDNIQDMIVVDSKLSEGTSFTPNQNDAKKQVGKTDGLRYKQNDSRIKDEAGDSNLPKIIKQNKEILLKNFHKLYSDGTGNINNINVK